MKPELAPSLKQQVFNKKVDDSVDSNEIAIGTPCKNGGCQITFQGSQSNDSKCIYHPGYPVFHEGLKFWSCCKKRTTDFQAFLNQVGCEEGNHLWKKEVQFLINQLVLCPVGSSGLGVILVPKLSKHHFFQPPIPDGSTQHFYRCFTYYFNSG